MKVNLAERHWIVSAVVLTLCTPALAGVGLAFTLAVAFLVDKVGLAEKIPLFPWLWMLGFVLTSAALWFLARWCARAGGWAAIGTAFGGCAALAAVSWWWGDVVQRFRPENPMAGVGGGIFAIVIVIFGVVALFCGAVAILTDPARRVPPLDDEDVGV